jgi:hypothetical protein
MSMSRWGMIYRIVVPMAALCCALPVATWAGTPPAQKVPSALLVFPLIQVDGTTDTRVELLNLSGNTQEVECFFVDGSSCSEIGFFVSLTAYQPLAWLIGEGLNDTTTGNAAPPFFGEGELKCAVVPPLPQVAYHNTIQGRATIFDTTSGQTISYAAVGFQRLTDGDFTGTLSLDGTTYAQCPDKLHFDVLADQPSSTSRMILSPCSQNLLLQQPTTVTVQVLVVNEFEQSFSSAFSLTCFTDQTLGSLIGALTRATLGSDTAQVILRGTPGPLLGLVVDSVPSAGTAGNEPSFEGGRSATVVFP